MANSRLGKRNIELLLGQYRSERKRLNYQLAKVRAAIMELKELRPTEDETAAEPLEKKKVGRPRKNAARATAAPKKTTRKKRKTSPEGYRLSNWDQMVIGAIAKKEQLMPKEDIVKAAITWAKKAEPEMNATEVEEKITRVLQKLTGKRAKLGTHRSGLRRGYHYGLKEWFFATSGKLRKQHLDRLVIK